MIKRALLALSLLLILAGLGLTIGGAFSPAWQVVDIREFRAEHQHGLWWDCIRAEKHVVAVGDFYDEAPLHCMYKFDSSAELVIDNTLNNVDMDGAAGEAEHHKFWAWHKALLFFIISSQFLAFLAFCTGICAPCFPPTTFCYTISLFIALLFSVVADGVFFLAANRVDNRFVQGMVGTYEQRIGYAFYVHLLGTIAWLFAFIAALVTTYSFFVNGDGNAGSSLPSFLLRSSRKTPKSDDRRRLNDINVNIEWQPPTATSGNAQPVSYSTRPPSSVHSQKSDSDAQFSRPVVYKDQGPLLEKYTPPYNSRPSYRETSA